jgi:hypothetical protein
LSVVVCGSIAQAQSIQLSPEQELMLNQLPPAQRQQAMDAMRQLETQQSSGVQQTINEPIEQPALPAVVEPSNADEPETTYRNDSLRPFGYDIFDPREASFDPPMSGPVPPDYVMGAGDTVRVQLFGNVNGIYEFEVTRDGILNLPEIGPVTVSGLPFSEFRADISRRVKEMLIGTQVSVTMGQHWHTGQCDDGTATNDSRLCAWGC